MTKKRFTIKNGIIMDKYFKKYKYLIVDTRKENSRFQIWGYKND